MTETKRLRALLDEHGIRWTGTDDGEPELTRWTHGGKELRAWEIDGQLHVVRPVRVMGAAEALDVTLDEGMCHIGSLIAVEGLFGGIERYEYETTCGGRFGWVEADHPRRCPCCGRRLFE